MREPLQSRNAGSSTAFTLLEILVAMSVLVLLLIMISQLVNSASQITAQSGKHLDSDTQARMLFERMAIDLSNMVKRPDVDTLFYKAPGNDKMFFFSHAPAYYDTAIKGSEKSKIALVGYRVTDQNGDAANFSPPYSLERLAKGLTWQGTPSAAAPGGVVFSSGTATPSNTLSSTWPDIGAEAPYTGTSEFFHAVADQVLRIEICFHVKDLRSSGTVTAAYSNYPVAITSGSNYGPGLMPSSGRPGDRWFDTQNSRDYCCASGTGSSAVWQPGGFKDVVSIVVTLAILENNSRKIVPDLTVLAGLFPDPVETKLRANPPTLPAQSWKIALETALRNNATGIPKIAASQIRIYQRHFYLNSNRTQ